jgi:Lon protease-like protein
MLEDALEEQCLICIATLTDEETSNPTRCTAPVGTLGLIRASREMEDGRSNLVLHGVIRVRFLAWPGGKDYPYAHIAPMSSDPLPAGEAPPMISKLRDKVNTVLSGFPVDLKEQINIVLDRASSDAAVLADAVAQQFVQDASLRLQLLSESSLEVRYDVLMAILDDLAAHD